MTIRFTLPALAILATLAFPLSIRAGDADIKVVAQLVKEIEQLSSLYAKREKPVAIDSLPKFSAQAIGKLGIKDVPPLETARGRWKANPEDYAKAVPLRAAYFTAAENVEQARRLIVPALSIPRAGISPKAKVLFLKKQEPLGVAIFKLEQALTQIADAEENRDKEKSMLWRARLDWARAVTVSDLIFLYEYNYTLGQVRADNLPELTPEHDGWKIQFAPKITITETKVKSLQKALAKHLKALQNDFAETPFAYFAERESRRDLGMTWVAKKK